MFLIQVRNDSNAVVALGSAFLIANNRLITNAHVVGGGRPVLKTGAVALALEIEKIDPAEDLAVLRLAMPLEVEPLTLAAQEPAIGTTVFALGNPQGLERTISEGIVSGVRVRGARRLLQVTAPISPGSSGGPVVTANGEVVGVTVGYLEGGQNLNFAIPVTAVRALLTNGPTGSDFSPMLDVARQAVSKPAPESADSAGWADRMINIQNALDAAAARAKTGNDFLALSVIADSAYQFKRSADYARAAVAHDPGLADTARAVILDGWKFATFFADSNDFGFWDHVRAVTDTQISRHARDALAYSLRARALRRLKRGREAIISAQRAVEFGQNSQSLGSYWSSYHDVVAEFGRPSEDDSVFQSMLNAGQANEYDWTSHAEHLAGRKEWQRAGDAYAEAGRMGAAEHRAQPLCEAGRAYVFADAPDAALTALRACIEGYALAARVDTGSMAHAHRMIASILNSRGVYAQAEAHAREAIAFMPDDAWAAYELSQALEKQERPSEAAAAAEQAIRLSDGKYATMHFAAGAAYFDLQNWSRCAIAFAKAAELDSTESGAPYNEALCLARQGYYSDAARAMEQVLMRNPNRTDRADIQRMIATWRR